MKEQKRADEIAAQHRVRILHQRFNRLVADQNTLDAVRVVQTFMADLLMSSGNEESALQGVEAVAEDLRILIKARAAARRAAN